MPHFGEIQSLTGTLRADGTVSRYYNSLTSTPVVSTTSILLEDGTDLLLESGSSILLDP